MGDAKRRGTFEQRKAAAIDRQKIEGERRAARKIEIEAAKTPEQKLKKHHAMMELMMMLGMAGASPIQKVVGHNAKLDIPNW